MLTEQAQERGQVEFIPDLEKVRAAGRRLAAIMDENLIASADTASITPQTLPEVPRLVVKSVGAGAEGHLLVVDDDEGNRDVLSRKLEKQGYTVANATDGAQALAMLASAPFDMVLLDIMMPDIDGYEVLRRMKADEHLRNLPVIMISALSDMESVSRCIEMGADDYLPKPFDPVLLRARVGASMEKKRSRDREIELFVQLQDNYKRLQDLERLRDDLTHMIVHDLRTPLSSLLAAVQTLDVVGDLNSAQREVVEIAVDGGGSLLGMINSLLDVEKFESGSMELDITLLSVPELIEAALAQVAPLAAAKDVELIRKVGSDLPWLQGDEEKLQRTLVNFLGNSIKFTPPQGSVTIKASFDEVLEVVRLCVSDTGEGIPEDALDRIFDKFGQVESRVSGRRESTGLGLTFCKLAVEAHGGQIVVESVPGEGSIFCFSLPVSRNSSMPDVG